MSRGVEKPDEWVVLIVDDSFVFRSILAVYLRDLVGTLLSAENGLDALEILAQRKVDLIVTDLCMPLMDGAQLLRAIRGHADRQIQAMPVILLTAEKDATVLRDAATVGANELVSKPIMPAALRQAVTRLLTPAPSVAC